ncbi:MAG: hypothetical protein CM15mP95_2270 [Alphaproteobacteria bacterium]|nr:MAG: hypothetical protein CM15mP95_2270 [Alphaproteobacteria bacterium]
MCMVSTGTGEPVQVVCGAPNARAGMKGVFRTGWGLCTGIELTLKAGEIRGEASNGMLCSEREMQLSDEHDGIIELPADAPVGQPFAPYAGLMIQSLKLQSHQTELTVLGYAAWRAI